MTESLKRTPFHDFHVALGGKIVPFAGYEMPVQYPTGITAEHQAVRQGCGVFDVSHMGEFIIRGRRVVEFVDAVTSNDVSRLSAGQVHYSTILHDSGTIVDDCLIYRFEDHVMMVVNASNREKDLAHISARAGEFGVTIGDISEDVGLLAVQGPHAEEILATLTEVDLTAVKYYHFTEGEVAGRRMIVSRTGYTGEDGFELYHDVKHSAHLWNALLGTRRITPCGLGARDSLRLEMGMALYGNDIDDTTTPFEAGLGWLVKLQKGEFTGRSALVRQKEEGILRKLVGFTTTERSFPRHGYPVFHDGAASGIVCSGTMSPSLGIPIGTCYLPTPAAKEGTTFEIEIRGRRVPATVMKMPFYKNASHK